MAATKEGPSKTERRNPVDSSGYHTTDPRDRQQEEREGLPSRCLYYDPKAPERDAPGQLETYVGMLTEVSIEKSRWQKIIEHANSLADELGMTHEQFYATALIEFIEKKENERITEELNEAYKNIDQEEDVAFLNRVVRHYDPRLADE